MAQAEMKVFFADAYLSKVADACAQKLPELRQQLHAAQQEFHQRLRPEIERGREVGRALAAPRGKDIDEMAKRLTDKGMARFAPTAASPGIQKFCQSILEEKSVTRWSIDDFLRQDFESLMMEVGNRQGLPCDFIPMRFERLARRFLDLRGPPSEALETSGFLLRSEVGDLQRKTSNCLAAQARAGEYRATPDKELEVIGQLLSSMQAVLLPGWDSRAKKMDDTPTAGEKIEEFLRRRVKK